jgi:hypothetical protein
LQTDDLGLLSDWGFQVDDLRLDCGIFQLQIDNPILNLKSRIRNHSAIPDLQPQIPRR